MLVVEQGGCIDMIYQFCLLKHRDEYIMEMETTNWLQHAVFTNSMPELTKALYNIAKDVIRILTEALESFSQAEAVFSRANKEEGHVRQYICNISVTECYFHNCVCKIKMLF